MKFNAIIRFAIATVVFATVTISGGLAQDKISTAIHQPVTIDRYVEEVSGHFTIKGQPIHPFVFRDLGGWISDSRPVITAVDVLAGADSNYYFSGSVEKTSHGFMAREEDGRAYYQYAFLGRLENELLVVQVDSSGGGSGVFRSLYFLDVFVDTVINGEGVPYERINLKAVRQLALGDRWDGDITIDGNKVIMNGKPMAHTIGPRTTRVMDVQRP